MYDYSRHKSKSRTHINSFGFVQFCLPLIWSLYSKLNSLQIENLNEPISQEKSKGPTALGHTCCLFLPSESRTLPPPLLIYIHQFKILRVQTEDTRRHENKLKFQKLPKFYHIFKNFSKFFYITVPSEPIQNYKQISC